MLKMLPCCFLMICTALTQYACAQLEAMPVHSNARWQVVAGLPEAPTASIAVTSLATNQIIGEIKPSDKFLAFGTDGKVVTFAHNGVIGYIPVTAVRDLYPVEAKIVPYKSWGPTLEEQVEAEKMGQKDIKNRSLAPLEKPDKKKSGVATPAAGAGGGKGGESAI